MGRRKTIAAASAKDTILLRISKSRFEILRKLGVLRGTSTAEATEYLAVKYGESEVHRIMRAELKASEKKA